MNKNATESAVGLVSPIPVDKWHRVIRDPILADVICDRILTVSSSWAAVRAGKNRSRSEKSSAMAK